MARIFQPARFEAKVPGVQAMQNVTDAAIVKGSVLIFTSGEVDIALTDSTPLVGVALQDVNTNPGFEVGHSSQVLVTTGRLEEISVALANTTTIFSGAATSDPTIANVGVSYGINIAAGIWTVDFTDTTTTRVTITDIDTIEDIVFFKFMPAHFAIL